jgi:hypothetical protein
MIDTEVEEPISLATHVPQVPKNFSTILKSLQDKGLANYCLIHELVLKRKKACCYTESRKHLFIDDQYFLFA